MLAYENDSWKQVRALGPKAGLGGYFFFSALLLICKLLCFPP